MENKSLYDNVNVKGKLIYWRLCEKESKKYTTMLTSAIKIPNTTEWHVRLEPEKYAIRSERHTTTPTACTKSKGGE